MHAQATDLTMASFGEMVSYLREGKSIQESSGVEHINQKSVDLFWAHVDDLNSL